MPWCGRCLVCFNVCTEQTNSSSVSLASNSDRTLSHLRKTKACLDGGAWVCSKTLQRGFSSRPSSFEIKNMLFFILYEKYRKSLCTVCTNSAFQVPGFGPDWLAGIVVCHNLDLCKKLMFSFPIRTIRVRLLSCRTFVISARRIQLFSNPLHCPHIVS